MGVVLLNCNGCCSLELQWVLRRASSSQKEDGVRTRFRILLALANTSRVTARFPYLSVRDLQHTSIASHGLDGNETFSLPPRVFPGWTCYAGGADHVIHPGQTLAVVGLQADHFRNNLGEFSVNGQTIEQLAITFQFQCGCENSRMNEGRLEIPTTALASEMMKLGFGSPARRHRSVRLPSHTLASYLPSRRQAIIAMPSAIASTISAGISATSSRPTTA